MKNKFILAVAVLVSATLITSCSMEKRHYMNGYHVEWNHKNKKNNNGNADANTAQTVALNETAPVVVVEENAAVVTTSEEAVAPTLTLDNTVAPVAVAPVAQKAVVTTEATQSESVKENVISKKAVNAVVKQAEKKSAAGDVPKGLLIVLCFLIPWLAVGLATDWDVKKVIINLLWSLTCIGGIIHALVVVSKSK